LSLEALIEAAKYRPPSATSKVSARRDLPPGSIPMRMRRRLAFHLVALIGFGIVLGVAFWWVASLLKP